MFHWIVIVLGLCLPLGLPRTLGAFVPFGFQEPAYENSNSFASSVLYDRYSRVVFLSGSTYSSAGLAVDNATAHYFDTAHGGLLYPDCYVHALTLSSSRPITNAHGGTELTPLYSRRFGTRSHTEACLASLMLVDNNNNNNNNRTITTPSMTTIQSQLVLLGSVQTNQAQPPIINNNYLLSRLLNNSVFSDKRTRTDEEEAGGFLSTLKPFGATMAADKYGFILQLDISSNIDPASLVVESSTTTPKDQRQTPMVDVIGLKATIQAATITQQYPIAFASTGTSFPNSPALFVLSRTTEPTASKDVFILQKMEPKSDVELYYESTYMDTLFQSYFGFSRFNIQSTTAQTRDLPWINGMKMTWNRKLPISQVDSLHDILFISTTPKPMLLALGDTWIAQYDLDTGISLQKYQLLQNSKLVKTCTHIQPDRAPFLYLVGYTTANNSSLKQVLLIKLDLMTMTSLWVRQVPSVHPNGDAIAQDCVVTSDDQFVLIGGNIESGNVLQVETQKNLHSYGGKDVFILSYQTDQGNLVRAMQFGTSQDDSLASEKSLALDENDNLIVFGNTRGSLMRLRTSQETMSLSPAWDFFVLNIEIRTGNMRPILEFSTLRAKLNKNKHALLWLLIIPLLILGCFLSRHLWLRYEKRQYGVEWTGTNDLVLQYLETFKDDRVQLHVRHSATGGIHGIYEFLDRRTGFGTSQPAPSSSYALEPHPGPLGYSTNSRTYSKARSDEFVRKSMFSIDDDDEEEAAAVAPDERNQMLRRSAPRASSVKDGVKGEIASSLLAKRRNHWEDTDYVGLVESYDSTWAERSAHSQSLS